MRVVNWFWATVKSVLNGVAITNFDGKTDSPARAGLTQASISAAPGRARQPQGISGTGETTGDKYQAIGVTQETFKGSFQNGQANDTFVNNFRIIGQAPGNPGA